MMAERGTLALTDPDAVQEIVDQYFDSRVRTRKVYPRDSDPYEEEYQVPPTMAGLALALGVTRTTLLFYGQGKGGRDDRLIPIIARAKMRIAEFAEEALFVREASNGAKFALEVNHGYGREGQQGEGSDFNMNVIPPAQHDAAKAIPKWSEESDE